jgi:hypothetical protein
MQVFPTHPMTAGIEHRSMQFHGEADVYQLNGAEAIARLAPGSAVDGSAPAVTLHQFGAGWAGMWAFDLARSVALMRQGNPELANIENGDWDGIRAINMFVDWIDLDRIDIPQADEQQRLLSNMITLMLAARVPLPRLGYFPFGAESLFVVTGDSHGNPGWAIEEALSTIERYNGHMSVYYTSFPNSTLRRAVKRASLIAKDLPVIGDLLDERVHAPTPKEIADWRARGHEFALHPYVEEGVEVGWETYWQEFTAMGYGPVSPTTRTHRIQWQGWVETAKIQAGYGIGLNLDYYVWGPIFQKPNGEWVLGHFTGSSYPMRFIDETGKIIQSYQALTQIADDHLLNLSWGGIAKLSPEEAARQSIQLIANSVDKYHAMHVVQFHVDPYVLDAESSAKERLFMQLILDFVSSRSIPIWSALDLLRFTEARDATHLENLAWDANKRQLTFSITSSAAQEMQLTALVPSQFAGLFVTQIAVDGSPVEFQDMELAGVAYSSFPASSQDHLVSVSYS